MVVKEEEMRDALASAAMIGAETDGVIELLSPKEAADRVGVKGLSTIHNCLRGGYLEAYNVAGRWRIPAVRLDAVEDGAGAGLEEEYYL